MKSTASALTTRPVQSLVVGCMTLLPESVVSKLAHLDDERGLRKSTGGLPRSTAPAGDRSPSDGRMDRPPAPSATRALPQRGRPVRAPAATALENIASGFGTVRIIRTE